MADIEVVIKLPEDDYKRIVKDGMEVFGSDRDIYLLECALESGVVLPKGHGALKDADKLAVAVARRRDNWNCYGNEYESATYQAYDNSVDEIVDAPTILEADEEEQT